MYFGSLAYDPENAEQVVNIPDIDSVLSESRVADAVDQAFGARNRARITPMDVEVAGGDGEMPVYVYPIGQGPVARSDMNALYRALLDEGKHGEVQVLVDPDPPSNAHSDL